jgi:uncharacterized protein YvpB
MKKNKKRRIRKSRVFSTIVVSICAIGMVACIKTKEIVQIGNVAEYSCETSDSVVGTEVTSVNENEIIFTESDDGSLIEEYSYEYTEEQTEEVTTNVVYVPSVPEYDLPMIYQNPELPSGCEATSATMLLQAYGYSVSKEEFADMLPKAYFEEYMGLEYAPSPSDAYIGSPYSSDGYGVFSKTVAETMQEVIDSCGGNHIAENIEGSSEYEILSYIDEGVPVCIWNTMSTIPLVDVGGWYIKDGDTYTDEYYIWPGNEHCLVLVSYDDYSVYVYDPLHGICSYDRETFFQRYEEVGSYAIILTEPE